MDQYVSPPPEEDNVPLDLSVGGQQSRVTPVVTDVDDFQMKNNMELRVPQVQAKVG